MRRAAALLLVLALSGCAAGDECTRHEDCPQDRFCEPDVLCVTAPCPSDNRCRPRGCAAGGPACPSGSVCEQGRCVR